MEKPLPDVVAPGLSVVFCGLNPGARAASAGHHFVGRSNRFWRVLHRAGFTPLEVRPEDDRSLLAYGLGLTTVVERPTASASELEKAEFVGAAEGLERWVRRHAPRCIAFMGKAGYANMMVRPSVSWGRQDKAFGGAVAWLLPNPSGRNRAFSLEALTMAYRELRLSAAAGFVGSAAVAPGADVTSLTKAPSPCA